MEIFAPGLVMTKEHHAAVEMALSFALDVMRPAGATLDQKSDPAEVISRDSVIWDVYPSLYASALLYADFTQNSGQYAGQLGGEPDIEVINNYVDKVGENEIKPFDFTIYVPAGYDNLSGKQVPNIEVTDDPDKILTASFVNGEEIWPEARL